MCKTYLFLLRLFLAAGRLRHHAGAGTEVRADPKPTSQANAFSTYLSARFAAERARHAAMRRAITPKASRTIPAMPICCRWLSSIATTSGDLEGAGKYAAEIVATTPDDRAARLTLAVVAFKHKDYAEARKNLSLSAKGPFQAVVSLFDAWAAAASGDARRRHGRHEDLLAGRAAPKAWPPSMPR